MREDTRQKLHETIERMQELEAKTLLAFSESRALTRIVILELEEAERRCEHLTKDFTEQEAADLLNISYTKLVELRRQKRFPHIRHGITVRYSAEHIRQILEMQTVTKKKK